MHIRLDLDFSEFNYDAEISVNGETVFFSARDFKDSYDSSLIRAAFISNLIIALATAQKEINSTTIPQTDP